MYDCPSALDAHPSWTWNRIDEDADEPIIWCYNWEFGVKLTSVSEPSSKVPMWEEGRRLDIAHRCRWSDGPNQFPRGWNDWFVPHGSMYNMPFLDGHVSGMSYAEAHANRMKLADNPTM